MTTEKEDLKMKYARNLAAALLALAAMSALVACGSSDESTGTTMAGGEESAAASGDFALLSEAPAGYSKLAGEAEVKRADGGTTVSVDLTGLQPRTPYIAHLHSGGCDQADPGGPHFQFEKGGSEEPPNELHLRFTSDASGAGSTEKSSKREVPVGEAGSVVLHVDTDHEMTAGAAAEAETVFVHEGVDHSKEGGHHESEPAHSDKIACAELEGGSWEEAGSNATAEGDVPTIVVRHGEPEGGVQELEYSAGEQIRFRVSSDEAEEIHVHGYDLSQEVPANGTVEFDFPAELEGIYEAELEEQGVQIIELRVNP
jgi:hypothetical protein